MEAMKTIKLTAIALMLCASVVTYAKPKKDKANKTQNTSSVAKLNCTVDGDGTVRNANGEVLGKLSSNGQIVNSSGQVLGSMAKTDAQKIGEIYFAD